MSYLHNSNYQRHVRQHPVIAEVVDRLETFCTENRCKMQLHGSVLTKSFYYGHSDIDAYIVAKNRIDHIPQLFSAYLSKIGEKKINKDPKLMISRSRYLSMPVILLHGCTISGQYVDIIIVEEEGFQLLRSTNPLGEPSFFVSLALRFLKFLTYYMGIISLYTYKQIRRRIWRSSILRDYSKNISL
jgi:hypothetical protein